MANTIIVSNRLPVSVKRGTGGFEAYPSVGGLATGLSSIASKRGNLWIGWPGIPSDDLTDEDKNKITRLLTAYNCQPVFLTKKQVDDYYNGYSNSILWPFFHSLPADFSNESKQWRAYREVNRLFAETVSTVSDDKSVIWVHDYQLLLVPEILRHERPTSRIGFFSHIPFPPAQEFEKLVAAPALIRGMMGADLVGFHTKDYVANFLDTAPRLTSSSVVQGGLSRHGRVMQVSDFPIGIDYIKFSQASRQGAVRAELRKLRLKYLGQKIILTVDRLDPTKGFVERLEAYRAFLDETPELRGKVTMVMLAVPSREEVKAYAELKSKIEKMVRDINKRFGSVTWKPIVYMYKALPFEQLSALYQLADVAFVAPIKDGMNLVAKEYIASQGGKKGVLILSQSAGAAQELQQALLVNHDRPRTLVRALKKAVKMSPSELKQRVGALQETIAANTIQTWAGGFLNNLSRPVAGSKTPGLTALRRDNLIKNYQSAPKKLLIFDYDGVLTPFAMRPDEARPPKGLFNRLSNLSKKDDVTLAIISGRKQSDIEKWFGKLPAILSAEHGALLRPQNSARWKTLSKPPRSWKRVILLILQEEAADTPGSLVEEKAYSLVWHYRGVPSAYLAQRSVARIKTTLKPLLKYYGLSLFHGNKILEIKDPSLNKGIAVRALLTKPYDFIMAVGDDFTDEDIFKALPKSAYTFKVGPGKTAARYRLRNVAQVRDLLDKL